ncbi:Rrf2 family transcriptional regulator [Idiomarina xiamenensis]|uniref:BadM/Rrf2 family transcriptional regulator n=1 Tax=Idiomarina xiamenensis 10-D-4 TaxID=740709 RepID=K2L6K7_9GAMM|nr:Rrf2 family transcriptional regulator [Idiomarina xiamenensis]EKE85425.1 hypothetical protein A10D4_03735 [Idiomarina xiamenensis 10-D-4]
MRTDSRLSRMLHVLLHMARDQQPKTSQQIATMLSTNAAVVRRTMGGLRRAGYVQSEKGHGGGWRIACDLNQVSLYDIYQAVGTEKIFTIGFDHSHPDCLVERVVNDAIGEALSDAERRLIKRLQSVSLGDLAQQFSRRYPT